MNRKSGSTETAQLLRVVTTVVVVAALYVGRTVFIPLALALLLSLLLAPVMEFLGRIHVPRLMAIFLVVVALCALAGGLGWKASTEFTDLANQLPIYKETLEGKIKVLSGLRSSNFSKVSNAVSDLERELTKSGPPEQDHSRKAPPPGSSIAQPMAVQVVPPSDTLASLGNHILDPMGGPWNGFYWGVYNFHTYRPRGSSKPVHSLGERWTADCYDPGIGRSGQPHPALIFLQSAVNVWIRSDCWNRLVPDWHTRCVAMGLVRGDSPILALHRGSLCLVHPDFALRGNLPRMGPYLGDDSFLFLFSSSASRILLNLFSMEPTLVSPALAILVAAVSSLDAHLGFFRTNFCLRQCNGHLGRDGAICAKPECSTGDSIR